MAEENIFDQLVKQQQKDYDSLALPEIYDTIDEGKIQISMRDGVKLATNIFHPHKEDWKKSSWPVILQRSPYPSSMVLYENHGFNLARRGFVYIVQSCRGTGGSKGVWEPNVNERQDGLDTLAWLQNESWAGSIGYWGDSYLALTGWCMADAVPDKVKGMYLGVYGVDRFASAYCKQQFRQDVLTSWAKENAGFPVSAGYEESYSFRPQIEVDEKLWGKKIPWYRDWITAVKEDDPYWQKGFWKQLRDIPKKITIPIFVMDGWYDHHLGSALHSWEMFQEATLEQSSLRIGSWNHYISNCLEWTQPEHLGNNEIQSMTDWFYPLLVEGKVPEKNVSVYIIGRDTWKELDSWPMPEEGKKVLYLHAGKNKANGASGSLEENEGQESSAEYDYDPEHPVPSHGAESMLHTMGEVGSLYQKEMGYREDVLSFVSKPLQEDLTIGGKIRVFLQVASDAQDTAFTAKLMKGGTDGRFVNIRSSITSIAADHPDEAYIPGSRTKVCIEMWDIAFEVRKGETLRLDISSSDFPQYCVHSNYAGIWSMQDKTKVAHQTIFCGGENGSRVEIPILREN